VEFGRLRPGDELSIAHIRFRLDNGQGHEATLADPVQSLLREYDAEPPGRELLHPPESPPVERVAPAAPPAPPRPGDNPLAPAVRGLLPSGLADRCRIQVIVQMDNDHVNENDPDHVADGAEAGASAAGAEKLDACRPDSSP